MRLYYSPGACSLSPHIIANEGGLPIELDKVTFGQGRTTEDGTDFYTISPNGYVPALKMDTGEYLTENIAIDLYLVDQAQGKHLMPTAGTPDYYKALEWLSFVSTELHKSFSPLYNPAITEDAKKAALDKIVKREAYLDGQLEGKQYLLGDSFSAADAYAYVIMRWNAKFDIDLSPFPNILAFMERMNARPAVQKSLAEEGLS